MKTKINIYAPAGALVLLLAVVVFVPATAQKYDSDKAWIGVYTQTMDKELQEAFDLDGDAGVVVVDVVDDSPADLAGLRQKDIIVKFNGHAIVEGDELADYVSEMKVGDKAEVVILRNGREKILEVEVGKRPKYDLKGPRWGSSYTLPRVITRDFGFSTGADGYIGVAIQDLTEQLGAYFGVENGEGVLITEVFEDSPAEEAGLKAGDVIVSVDGKAVAEMGELQEIISEKNEGDEVTLGFLRKGNKEKAVVTVAEDALGMKNFTIPHLNFPLPNLSRFKAMDHLYFGDEDRDFDAGEYKREMEQLKRELREMGEELKKLRLKLE